MTLVETIKKLCLSTGDTFASLEKKLGFGNATIRKWDDATPSGDRLAKIADYFGVSVDYLLGRKSTFKNRLKQLRVKNGYSMDELCETYNLKCADKLNRDTLSRYENGLQEPTFIVIQNLANILNTSTNYLIGQDDLSAPSDFMRVFDRAKKEGFSAKDIEKALDFFKYAENRDKE